MFLILIVISLTIIIIILLVYIIYINNQLKSISKQIENRIKEKSIQPINVMMINKNLNCLVADINKILMEEEASRFKYIRYEKKLKDMTANISHDLRTPLTAIKGYIQLLDKKILDGNQKNMIHTALNHIGELDNLINNFFELSYLEISNNDTTLKKINLTNIVSNNIVDYIYQFEEKNLYVDFNVNDPIYVLGDEEKIKRIIQNLIKNCLHYAQEKIIVNIFNEDENIILSFKNSVSNPEEIEVHNLFDRFYIADKSRNSSKGLGLSIVKLLTEQMKGSVKASLDYDILEIQIVFKKYI